MSYLIIILIYIIVLNLLYAIPYLKADERSEKYNLLFRSLKYSFEELKSQNSSHAIRSNESMFKFNALNNIILGNYYHKKNLEYIITYYNNVLKHFQAFYQKEWRLEKIKAFC